MRGIAVAMIVESRDMRKTEEMMASKTEKSFARASRFGFCPVGD
jgi:hypothetical protein